MITIAVDAMGGDLAPRPEVEGSVLAAREFGVRVLLVGIPAEVKRELARHSVRGLSIEVIAASEVIAMSDSPAQAFRRKKDSSAHIAARLVRSGQADALVSAGNTGALMTVARFVLVMGEIYYRAIFSTRRPKVALLSIGEEESKGNELTKEAYNRLKELPLNFIGNIEGRDVFSGSVDVIVCDGFIGNVALKISEGVAQHIAAVLKKALKSTIASQVGYVLSRSAYQEFRRNIDYSEYGGAPLLGVRGIAIIGHGRSNANAIKNAVRVAAEMTHAGLNERIERELSSLPIAVGA